MKNYLNLLIAVFFAFGFTSCSSDAEDFEEKNENVTTTTEKPDQNLQVENFIYRGMSDIYLYQKDVPELAAGYFSNQSSKDNFLATFATPEKLFDKLTPSHDRFSYLIEDYRDMNRMAAGTTSTTGMSFGLVRYCNSCSEIFGYIRLVQPNSPAQAAGVERGMIFNRVNGQQLTASNFSSLLNSNNFSIGLATIEGSEITELDRSIDLSKREMVENPIVISKTLNVDGTKVGYLLYDSFTADFDEQLNNVFGEFKSAGVTELILDLRYNGGGSVRTATDLASMITGQFPNKLFMKEKWNDKYQAYFEEKDPKSLLNNFNSKLRTGTAINHLNLSRVFVLTTGTSASASELVINGLDPYIDVVHVGDVTTGKFQASVAIYDSPDFSKDSNLNSSHYYAIQPLVLKSHNANNVSDYVNGLIPDHQLKEDVRNMGKLGEPGEPLLDLAINLIKGNRISVPEVRSFPVVGESDMFKPTYKNMYLEKELPLLKN